MDFEKQIISNCGSLLHDRIRICQMSKLELATIPRCVLFVFATWSGAAIISFRLLCEMLSRSQLGGFPLLVVDADSFDFNDFKEIFGELPQGKGEAFWIKQGQVLFRDRGYTDAMKDTLKSRIDSFSSL